MRMEASSTNRSGAAAVLMRISPAVTAEEILSASNGAPAGTALAHTTAHIQQLLQSQVPRENLMIMSLMQPDTLHQCVVRQAGALQDTEPFDLSDNMDDDVFGAIFDNPELFNS
ncbi:hypothetical protein JKP88DRAFT_286714 [Tribonema minus]|uniref:Uncharacterized protein n=1 Tax=Tribonema minus TaxID=303371 RepID=A0A836CKD0_9STRA|nr:hypothetical protein JKP88DRAFT_286714 [Tribonema minus]